MKIIIVLQFNSTALFTDEGGSERVTQTIYNV